MIHNCKLLVFSAISLLALSSCLNIRSEKPEILIESNSLFDWKTVSTFNLKVNVGDLPTEAQKFFSTVKVYTSSDYKNSSLILTGSASKETSFSSPISVPTNLDMIYIEITTPYGSSVRYSREVTGSDISLGVVHNNLNTKAVDIPNVYMGQTWAIPSKFDYIITSTTFDGPLVSVKDYRIRPEDNIVLNNSTTIFSTAKPFSTVYVFGKLTLNNTVNLDKVSLVVADGGEVIIHGDLTATLYNRIERASIYVLPEGKLTVNGNIELDVLNSMVNKGEVIINNGNFITGDNRGGELFNIGTITINNGGMDLKKGAYDTSSSKRHIQNSGTITCDFINISDTKLRNYGGVINTGDISFVNQNTDMANALTNYGYVYCNNINMNAKALIYNFWYIGIDGEFNNNYAPATGESHRMYIYPDAMTEISKVSLSEKAFTVVMSPNSIFYAEEFSASKAKFLRESSNQLTPLIRIKDVMDLDNLTVFKDEIEIYFESLNNATVAAYASKLGNAFMVGTENDRVNSIPWSDANKGYGLFSKIVDNDGDGVPEGIDIDDNDPEIAYEGYYPSSNSYATVMFEDLWPYRGDYDMNDLVVDFQIIWTMNARNEVVYMDYNWKLRAAGSSKNIGMAVQLDNILPTAVKSVVSTYVIEGNAPFETQNGLETGQAQAVFPIFNDYTQVFGVASTTGFINTYPGTPKDSQNENIRITFNNPVALSNVALNSFNIFITTSNKGNTGRGVEIHLPGYNQTSKGEYNPENGNISEDDIYIADNGMMWAIMIPQSIRYPFETVDIENAYLKFRNWYQSFGSEDADWYINNIDESKLY